MIVHGTLPSGTDIAETELCARLGMSRTPLREAMKRLEAEGLVELRRNRTARITAVDPVEIRELFEAVACMERSAAELAALRITEAELKALARMQATLLRTRERSDLAAYFATNQRIHRTIVGASKNRVLIETHDRLMARVERARLAALRRQGRWEESIEEHRAILMSLEAHDPVRAGALLGQHVRRTGEAICSLIAEAGMELEDA
jgi:DNA-binding GntR family transcriptional regulator